MAESNVVAISKDNEIQKYLDAQIQNAIQDAIRRFPKQLTIAQIVGVLEVIKLRLMVEGH